MHGQPHLFRRRRRLTHPTCSPVFIGLGRARVPRSEPTRRCKMSCNYGAQAVPKNREFAGEEDPKCRGAAEPCGVRPQREQGSLRLRIFHPFSTLRTGRGRSFGCAPAIMRTFGADNKSRLCQNVGVGKKFAWRQIGGPVAGGLRRTPPRPYTRALLDPK